MNIFDVVYQDIDYYPRPSSFLVERLPNDLSGMRFLDLGCGNGRNSLELLRRGGNVIAADPSQTGLGSLLKRAEHEGLKDRLKATAQDIRSLDLSHLDGVVLSTVLDHVDAGEARGLLDRIAPALATSSWIYASAFTYRDPGANGRSRSETNAGVVHYWDPITFAALIERRLSCKVLSAKIDWKVDDSHGPRHLHHLVHLLAIKGSPRLAEPPA